MMYMFACRDFTWLTSNFIASYKAGNIVFIRFLQYCSQEELKALMAWIKKDDNDYVKYFNISSDDIDLMVSKIKDLILYPDPIKK